MDGCVHHLPPNPLARAPSIVSFSCVVFCLCPSVIRKKHPIGCEHTLLDVSQRQGRTTHLLRSNHPILPSIMSHPGNTVLLLDVWSGEDVLEGMDEDS